MLLYNILTLKCPQIQSQSINFPGGMPPDPLTLACFRTITAFASRRIIPLCPPVFHYISFRSPLAKILKETLMYKYIHKVKAEVRITNSDILAPLKN